jgi:hypothetical protein
MFGKYSATMMCNFDYVGGSYVKKILLIILVSLAMMPAAQAQSYAGAQAAVEPTMLIDKPTAGLLRRGTYEISSDFFQQGGVLGGISVGVFEQFMFGISYGGTNIIGKDKAAMNPLPGVNVKLRILSENFLLPALAIGFDSQGKEPYLKQDSLKRYTIKSPGVYAVASKNYAILGNLSVHGGINKSMESDDGDKDLDLFVGAEKSLGPDISLMAEYDFATNDNSGNAIGKGNGYLNFGFRWTWGKGLTLGFNLKNVSKNQNNVNIGNRTVQIDYVGEF